MMGAAGGVGLGDGLGVVAAIALEVLVKTASTVPLATHAAMRRMFLAIN
jgi:hypothetical protein